MSIIHVRHVSNTLKKIYDNKIDLSGLESRTPEQLETHFLTRALSAYSLSALAEIDPIDAIPSIVDDFNDNGIDSLTYEAKHNTLWIIQSKWFTNGNSSPDVSDISKLVNGVKDLINCRFDRFNEKIQKKEMK